MRKLVSYTGWPRIYCKYILQITQPFQYRYAKSQYRFAVISGSPSIFPWDVQSGPNITANLYIICLSECETCAYADAVPIFGNLWNALYIYIYSPRDCNLQNIPDNPVQRGIVQFLIRSNRNRLVFHSLPSADVQLYFISEWISISWIISSYFKHGTI